MTTQPHTPPVTPRLTDHDVETAVVQHLINKGYRLKESEQAFELWFTPEKHLTTDNQALTEAIAAYLQATDTHVETEGEALQRIADEKYLHPWHLAALQLGREQAAALAYQQMIDEEATP